MSRRSLALTLTLALQALALAQGPPSGGTQATPQAPSARVRVSVDVIAVDVQVLDDKGQPIPGLGPERFNVTINGRRRKVVSAEFVQARLPDGVKDTGVVDAATLARRSHVFVIAIDCVSFSPNVVRRAVDTARQFVMRLGPDDLVGVFAYPSGPAIDPTTDRARVSRALDSVIGQRETLSHSQFNLRPSEIVDIASELPNDDGPILQEIAQRECGAQLEMGCLQHLVGEVTNAALYYEAQATVSVSDLRALLKRMGVFPGRKTVILISGGMMTSDRTGGRPDISSLSTEAGREAARASAAVYTVNLDTIFEERSAAQTALAGANRANLSRDAEINARWLQQFAGGAGGAYFRVVTGSADYAFDRIFRETSAYYLLGIDASEADRGLTQEIKVKVDQRQATVRSRRWVTLPQRTPGANTATAAAATPAAEPAAPVALPPPPPVPFPDDVQPLADAFERGGDAALHKVLPRTKNLATVIRSFRTTEAVWPGGPKGAAVFALELAMAGLHSDNGFARDEGARLLAEYTTRVRQPSGADAFECTWLWAQSAGLGGLLQPGTALAYVRRAVARCPNEPRLHLADAIVTEQQWLSVRQPDSADTSEVIRRYQAATKYPETALEACVRGAWFLLRQGDAGQALEWLRDTGGTADDTYPRYLAELVRGRVLDALGRSDEAAASLRAALVTWPSAQSARVALMTLLVKRGNRQEAAALAAEIETSPDDAFDPWWMYGYGDYRVYPTIVERLRELSR